MFSFIGGDIEFCDAEVYICDYIVMKS